MKIESSPLRKFNSPSSLLVKSPILQARNLSFSFDGFTKVIDDVSLTIYDNEFIGIAGPNGAGKSTLLKLLVGLLNPSSGSRAFTCNLSECVGYYPCRPCIGYVPQQNSLDERNLPVSVRDVVSMGLYGQIGLFRKLSDENISQIDKVITESGLKSVENEQFSNISGGQKQRTFMARALVSNPHLLALDEPVSSVDQKGKEEFYSLLSHYHKKHSLAIIMVLHDLSDLTQITDRTIFLKNKVLYDGPSKKLGKDGLLKLMFGENLER